MKKDSKSADTSAGYPTLEALIEQPSVDFAPMKARRVQLVDLSRSAKLAQDKAAAKQASVAYDRFFKLVDELLQIKAKMAQDFVAKSAKGKKTR